MKRKIYLVVIISVLAFSAVITGFVVKSQIRTDQKQESQFPKEIPVTVNKLKVSEGVGTVNFTCENATLATQNSLNKVTCNIINNTNKNITAFVVNFSIDTEVDNTSSPIDGSITAEMLFDQSFINDRRTAFIHPNEDIPVFLMPNIFEEDSII
jgi:peptidoglycan hydrolase CwlO-like protein